MSRESITSPLTFTWLCDDFLIGQERLEPVDTNYIIHNLAIDSTTRGWEKQGDKSGSQDIRYICTWWRGGGGGVVLLAMKTCRIHMHWKYIWSQNPFLGLYWLKFTTPIGHVNGKVEGCFVCNTGLVDFNCSLFTLAMTGCNWNRLSSICPV